MKKVFIFIIYSFFLFIGIYMLGAYAIHALVFQEFDLVNLIKFRIIWFKGDFYFWFLTMVSSLLVFQILLNVFFNKKSKYRRNEERRLTREEKESFSYLSSKHESKKGLMRIEFDRYGNLKRNTWRDVIDRTFNPLKVAYNSMLDLSWIKTIFHTKNIQKMNTIKHYEIGDKKQNKRGGVVVISHKKRIYVDAEDNHTIILGTTNSGKTYSTIHILIENLRMCGESMIINDVKGELLKIHKDGLIKSGYKVLELNYINPEASEGNNPLTIVIQKWREAEENYRLELAKWDKNLSEDKPMLDCSEAIELLTDIANTLTHDENTKDPFWNSQAATLIVGYVCLLLEEREINLKTGELEPLDINYINFKSVKMVHILGNTPVGKDQSLLGLYIKQNRKPDDMSYMKLYEYTKTVKATKASIDSVFASKIDILTMNEQIMRMTGYSSFDIEDIGNKKTAVFVLVHDEKKTYHPLFDIFLEQVYQVLVKSARNRSSLRLKYPVNIIWDEFGISKMNDIQYKLPAMRSRGMRMFMVIQSYSQLIDRYGKDVADDIKNNALNTIYLLGADEATKKEISSKAGNKLIWNKEKDQFESLPVVTTDRLSKLELGSYLMLRQRRNPYIGTFVAFNKYSFYKNLNRNSVSEVKKQPHIKWWNIEETFHKKQKSIFLNQYNEGSFEEELDIVNSVEKPKKILKKKDFSNLKEERGNI